MALSWLLLILLALAVIGFFAGRSRALASAGGNVRDLHSLPSYYGYNVALTALVPAVGVLIVWLLAQPMIVNSTVSGLIPDQAVPEGSDRGLIMSEVRRVAYGLDGADKEFGYIVDYFSGTLFGEHSVIYTVVFLVMYLGNRQVHIRGALRKAMALALLTFLQGIGLMWMEGQFRGANLLPIAIEGRWWVQALVNAAAAPFVLGWILRLTAERDGDASLQASAVLGSREGAR